MIDRDRSFRSNDRVPMEDRYHEIMKILKETQTPISARDIARKYMVTTNESDKLVTSTILNVLALAGVVVKHPYQKGKSTRYRYSLPRS